MLGVGLIVEGRDSAVPRRLPRQLHHLQQHGFAGIDQFFQRDAVRVPLRCDAPSRASSGTWTNAARRGPSSRLDRLDRAPAQIIAEIAAGIARGPRVDAGADARRAAAWRCAGRTSWRRRRRRSIPCARACASASGHSMVTALRARVSIRTCAVRVGEAEHQQRLRAMLARAVPAIRRSTAP